MTAAVAQPASPGSAPPRLSHVELVEAQAETFASPRRSYGLAARALFATLDACYGKPRTLSKFKVLELVARVPYRAWELVGAGVGRLRQRLLDSSAGHRYLVLDLTAVDRIDSTGLGAPSTRATPAADTHLADLLARYSLVRRFLPALVTTLRLHAALAGADVLAAAFTSVLVIALKPGADLDRAERVTADMTGPFLGVSVAGPQHRRRPSIISARPHPARSGWGLAWWVRESPADAVRIGFGRTCWMDLIGLDCRLEASPGRTGQGVRVAPRRTGVLRDQLCISLTAYRSGILGSLAPIHAPAAPTSRSAWL